MLKLETVQKGFGTTVAQRRSLQSRSRSRRREGC